MATTRDPEMGDPAIPEESIPIPGRARKHRPAMRLSRVSFRARR
jgi:hypothetical protein